MSPWWASENGADRTNRLDVNQGGGEDGGQPLLSRRPRAVLPIPVTRPTPPSLIMVATYNLYVLNTAMVGEGRTARRIRQSGGGSQTTDRLYRNDDGGAFTDVSDAVGIRHKGHGPGLAISDLNGDGWPDIDVANDFISKDRVYVNEGDGTFVNRSARYLNHQSYSALGAMSPTQTTMEIAISSAPMAMENL